MHGDRTIPFKEGDGCRHRTGDHKGPPTASSPRFTCLPDRVPLLYITFSGRSIWRFKISDRKGCQDNSEILEVIYIARVGVIRLSLQSKRIPDNLDRLRSFTILPHEYLVDCPSCDGWEPGYLSPRQGLPAPQAGFRKGSLYLSPGQDATFPSHKPIWTDD